MQAYDPKLDRLSTVLLLRGYGLLAFAGIAVRWPDQSLSDAVRYAGGIAVFLGAIELAMSIAGHTLLSVRAFRVGHAVTSVAFGVVAAMARDLPVDQALVVATVWLAGYTAFLLLLMARLWYFRRMRDGLLLWAAVNVAAIAGCVNLMGTARVSLLLGGALYTAALGVVTIVAARWMRRGWMAVEQVPAMR